MKQTINIVIAEDHPIFRKGLKDIINGEHNMKVIDECGDGSKVLSMIKKQKPDVLILDLNLPERHGLEVLNEIQMFKDKLKTIILTMHNDEETFNKAIDLGVAGYVLKESAGHDILESIRAVVNDQMYISPTISSYLLKRRQRNHLLHELHPSIENLTEMERKILKLISENKSSKEIATLLFISDRTVQNHRMNICNKLNLHGSFSLLKFAIENKNKL
ncbi:MAG: response regulator transcription factor [Ignavibacteriae bacterium]|nr:response regulator transcription factor [Ignavibacteriota bacterium]